MDQADEFLNTEDTLQALASSHQEVRKGERRGRQLERGPDMNRQGRKPDRQ